MINSRHKFNKIANPEAKKADYPPPFSIRFTFEERAWMDAERGDKSLSAYIREHLFGANAAPRKKRGNSPVQDKEALGRMAGALGQSRLSQNMNQLAKAVNTGSLPVTSETEAEIKEACRDIAEMRKELMVALGKAPGSEP
ncbi:hypothetical protein ACSSV4_003178 [Roseovarius sp. MBR-154]|jgi:hypothetical protein